MPCADIEVNSATHTKTELTSNREKHSHDKEIDLCPPFCACNCCGSQMANYSHPIIFDCPTPFKNIQIQLPTYISIFSSNFYGSIWQPPQIA